MSGAQRVDIVIMKEDLDEGVNVWAELSCEGESLVKDLGVVEWQDDGSTDKAVWGLVSDARARVSEHYMCAGAEWLLG